MLKGKGRQRTDAILAVLQSHFIFWSWSKEHNPSIFNDGHSRRYSFRSLVLQINTPLVLE